MKNKFEVIAPRLVRVFLTKGMTCLVDTDDLYLIAPYRWCAAWMRDRFVAITNITVQGKHKTLYMHRLLLNSGPEDKGDHINGDSLDNRRENLRRATIAQNNYNKRLAINNTSGYKGVTFDKATGKYIAQIEHEGINHKLGRFATAIEAAEAYDKVAEKLFGEYAKKNLH